MGKAPFHVAVAACAAVLLPSVAGAATDAEVQSLRDELAKVKAEYAQRLSALEAQIQQLQPEPDVGATAAVDQAIESSSIASAGAVPPAADAIDESIEAVAATGATDESIKAAAPAEQPGGPPTTAGKSSTFNPAISLILAGNYANLSNNPDDYAIQGFIPGGDEIGPGDRSFNLGESELTIASNIDPYFMGSLTAAISGDNEISVEEAYFRTTALPYGATIKGGQFYSSLGYLNDIHAHAWDFTDQPLVYQAFFGGQMAVQGLQAKWIAPLDLLVELGVESGNGNYFPGTSLSRNGLNGYVAYAHFGGDIGDSVAWRTGLSYVDLHAQDREFEAPNAEGESATSAFTGSSKTWIADAEFKWTPIGDPRRQYLKIQGEYMQRREDGRLAYLYVADDLDGSYTSDQSGWYVQGVYQFLPRWRFGARYDSLDSGNTKIGLVKQGILPADDFSLLLPGSPTRTTIMFDWNPSEFSRIRAQYAWDDASAGPTDEQFFLQYIYAMGAHGAHKF
ncbi:MAG: hypothetical protein MUO39_09565 [Steroidobacteraceae bacterium]|nr:hypothetical protein [Steroidobacteraceae bacterium]